MSTGPYTSKSEAPKLFDGTTRLWISKMCPYAQRVWTAVNFKELNDVIEVAEIDLTDRPTWYKETVYPVGKVPALEHANKVVGESLDLLEYLDAHFGGPKLVPEDEDQKKIAKDLLQHVDAFIVLGYSELSRSDISSSADIEKRLGPELDYLEATITNFSPRGPFLLGNFSMVDAAAAPFLHRFQLLFEAIKNYDLFAKHPRLQNWLKHILATEAYSNTLIPAETIVNTTRRLLEAQYFRKVGLAEPAENTPA